MTEEAKMLAENVAEIRHKMEMAAKEAGRAPQEIALCAACKTRSVETVRLSAECPIDIFGENHVQELVEKFDAGAYLGKPSHMIGHLQTNKVKFVVGRASLIHSVDSVKLLATIEKEAAKRDLVQDILLEVNVGEEESKGGVLVPQLGSLVEQALTFSHIRLRGLMTVPEADATDEENRRQLAKMYTLYRKLAEQKLPGTQVDILSMGMSGDFENAIKEGATLVRVGTAIYGARYYPNKA